MINKLDSIKSSSYETKLRCHKVIPSADNPQKERVEDYKSRGIIFNSRDSVVRAATHMLILADSEEMKKEGATINLTVHTSRHNCDGYGLTINVISDKTEEEMKLQLQEEIKKLQNTLAKMDQDQ